MKDIVFLFGAGASYGAGDIIPERPPLGYQLYNCLDKNFPNTWGAFPIEIKNAFKNNFEQGMELIYNNYSQVIPLLMQQMSIFFIQFRPFSASSLYCKLIRSLKKINLLNSTLFSTLNYECILEFSFLNHGIQITYFNEGSESEKIPVWKLHGSCNMFSKDIHMSRGVLYSRGVVVEAGLEAYCDIGTVVEKCLSDTGMSTAMCLFMKGKPLQISPSVINKLQIAWKEAILLSKIVVCIGVNPLPEDEYIWNPLKDTKAMLYYVGDKDNFENWKNNYRIEPSEFIAPYFNIAFDNIIRRIEKHEINKK